MYKCDEKQQPEHVCKAKAQLFLLEFKEEVAEEIVEEEEQIYKEWMAKAHDISIDAINGKSGYITWRVADYGQRRPFNILIDIGSTHKSQLP